MLKKLFVSVFILLSVFLFSYDNHVIVTNSTGFDGYYLYVSHEDSDSWEEDVLKDDVLLDGDSYKITVEGYPSTIFDIQLEDEDGDTYTIWDVDIESEDLELTIDDLDYEESDYVIVKNSTGFDGYFLYVSHEYSDYWEEDVLGDDVLMDGDSFRITVDYYPTSVFDIRMEDEDGDTYTIWDVDIAYDDLEITIIDLDG